MAEVASGGSDAVAVDIEVFEDCQQSSSSSEDDQEEIAFRREDLNGDWISSIKGKTLLEPELLKSSSASKSCSIHRFPSWLRQQNSTGYEPKVISIGPLHYEKREGELRAMEEHKWKYLHGILSRKHEGWLEDCLAAVKGLEERARNCYSEVIPLGSDRFVEMMVLDACFILEFFQRFHLNDYTDFILQFPFLIKALHFDLLLLENQIPFFILERLYVLIDDASGKSPPLVESALSFFLSVCCTAVTRLIDSKIMIRHLLHLLHACYATFVETYTMPYTITIPRIPSASELEKVGIKFRMRDVDESEFLDIRFVNGFIEIPNIPILENTMEIDRQFLNLVAFEQCYPHCRKYVTSYAIFMNYLINSGKDVKILCREGIIMDGPGNKELVAYHLDNLLKGVMMDYADFYLSDVCEKINKYSRRTTPKLRASFKSYLSGYFKNPWAIISFSAAVLLLLLTLTQTFFTTFPKFAYGN